MCMGRAFGSIALAASLGLAAAGLSAQPASQTSGFPQSTVRMIVPAAPGSGPDALGRMLSEGLHQIWGQAVIVDNVVGASGTIGHDRGAKAAPDGYTLLMGLIGPMSVSSHLMDKLPYDPVKDLAPVTLLITLPNVLAVHPSIPVKNLAELIDYAKQNPGKLRYGFPGVGTSNHLSAEQFNMLAGIKTTGVPYRGSAQMTTDLIGGHIDMMFHNAPVVLPHIKTGALKAIAITSAKRNPAAPDIPTLGESGVPGYEVTSWYAMYVPAGTPKPIIERLNADIGKVLKSDKVRNWMEQQAGVPGGGTPEQLAEFQASESAKWRKLVQAANLKAQSN